MSKTMNKLFLLAVFASFVAAALVVWRLMATDNFPLPLPGRAKVQGNASDQMMQILGATVDDGGKSDMTQLDREVSQLD